MDRNDCLKPGSIVVCEYHLLVVVKAFMRVNLHQASPSWTCIHKLLASWARQLSVFVGSPLRLSRL
jgi:hypothetical protein